MAKAKDQGMQCQPLSGKASLSGIRRLIRADLNSVGADESLAFDCLVAVTEACSNALLHGQARSPGSAPPEISWEISKTHARFVVVDFSTEEWSRTIHPSWDSDEIPEDMSRRIGGFGLEIMKGLMDDVDIEVAANGTRVSMVKLLTGPPQTSRSENATRRGA
ncbi:MAG: ATP-binding protein [Actinomycetota bacterium]|nr:ATP-binding protein [Actinomycetota bacterium]